MLARKFHLFSLAPPLCSSGSHPCSPGVWESPGHHLGETPMRPFGLSCPVSFQSIVSQRCSLHKARLVNVMLTSHLLTPLLQHHWRGLPAYHANPQDLQSLSLNCLGRAFSPSVMPHKTMADSSFILGL